MNIKKALRVNLAIKGMTQAELAVKAGTTEQTLSKMNKDNEASTKVLRKICAALDITLWQFIKDGGE